jgi:hypothetical protein
MEVDSGALCGRRSLSVQSSGDRMHDDRTALINWSTAVPDHCVVLRRIRNGGSSSPQRTCFAEDDLGPHATPATGERRAIPPGGRRRGMAAERGARHESRCGTVPLVLTSLSIGRMPERRGHPSREDDLRCCTLKPPTFDVQAARRLTIAT